MKLLLFHATDFAYTTDTVGDLGGLPSPADRVVVFVHAEAGDEIRLSELVRKAAKNIKWLANKRELTRVTLHSFAHLAETKAKPEFAAAFLSALSQRLQDNDYLVESTAFGFSHAWRLSVHQDSIAKVFKSL